MVSLRKDLFIILRGFAGLVSPNSLSFPTHHPFPIIHDFFLNNILLDPHLQAYPPSSQYQKQFWKWVIGNLEDLPQSEEDPLEIDSRIYEHYLDLLPPSALALGSTNPSSRSQICGRGLPLQQLPPSQSYITRYWKPRAADHECHKSNDVDLAEYQTVTLLESRTTIENGTTGLRTWRASYVFAQYLIIHPDLVSSRRVLELGSGVGFLGVIIASLQQLSAGKLPGNPLWLTDVNEEVLTRCKENVGLPCNSLSTLATANYKNLDWSAALDNSQVSRVTSILQEEIDADLIVGADIVFDPSLIPALVAVLKIALHSRGKSRTAIIALTIRNEDTIKKFLERLHASSLEVVDIPLGFDRTDFTDIVDVGTTHEDIKIFQITV